MGVRQILGQPLHVSEPWFSPLQNGQLAVHRKSVYPPHQPNLMPAPASPSTDISALPHIPSMDRDGTMTIDWQEWRDHFLLHSLENVEDVVYFWKHSTVRWGQLAQLGGWALLGLPQAWRGWVRSLRRRSHREGSRDEGL